MFKSPGFPLTGLIKYEERGVFVAASITSGVTPFCVRSESTFALRAEPGRFAINIPNARPSKRSGSNFLTIERYKKNNATKIIIPCCIVMFSIPKLATILFSNAII
jgi:hypothetical protein